LILLGPGCPSIFRAQWFSKNAFKRLTLGLEEIKLRSIFVELHNYATMRECGDEIPREQVENPKLTK
jgi:hypothetical protein